MPYPLWTPVHQLLEKFKLSEGVDHSSVEISCCVEEENPLKGDIAYELTIEESWHWPRRGDLRRRMFTDCIEKYYQQIRHGCGNLECRTVTCRTFQAKRHAEPPYRTPTKLTARAMAFAMASDDEPRRRLCPYLSFNSDLLDCAFAGMRDVRRLVERREPTEDSYTMEEVRRALENCDTSFDLAQEMSSGTLDLHKKLHSSLDPPLNSSKATSEADCARIDSKSFTQKVFDSASWRFAKFVDVQDGLHRLVTCQELSNQLPYTDDNTHGSLFNGVSDHIVTESGFLRITTCAKHRDLRSRAYLTRLNPKIVKTELSWTSLVQIHKNPNTTNHETVAWPRKDDPNVGLDYCKRSIVYVLCTPTALIKSFLEEGGMPQAFNQQIPTIGILDMRNCFADLAIFEKEPKYIFPSIWESLAEAYLPYSHRPNPKCASNLLRRPLGDCEAAHFVCIALGALVSSVPLVAPLTGNKDAMRTLWNTFVARKRCGRFIPSEVLGKFLSSCYLDLVWTFEDEQAVRLMKRCLRVFSSRSYTVRGAKEVSTCSSPFIEHIVHFLTSKSEQYPRSDLNIVACSKIVLEWARVVLHQAWDGKAEFSWSSDTGSVIEFMRLLYQNRSRLQLCKDDFGMPYLFKVMDFMEMPRVWVRSAQPSNYGHLLSYPWLFPQSAIITYFRVINHSRMFKAVNGSASMQALIARHKEFVSGHEEQIFGRLKTAMSQFLVLEIKRVSILDDALNELWRRQRRELLRPLKIRMGMHEGEEGVDLGGVQQEFFRLAVGEALDPEYGLFSIDESTRMAWFLPCSLAPRYQFTLIGILVGLAIYNGVSLSVTFPLAFYRKLLGLPVISIDHIEDGWPILSKGFRAMMDYPDADVEDVFMVSYVFSVENNGALITFDMEEDNSDIPWLSGSTKAAESSTSLDETDPKIPDIRAPGAVKSVIFDDNPSPFLRLATGGGNDRRHDGRTLKEAGMVTSENREQYTTDYISWLTDKSVRPQYEAFAEGFFMCMDRKALTLFSPETLKDLVEGFQDVDLSELRATTIYENGYSAQHPFIQTFWKVVQKFSPKEVRRLLEFVTASDRIPAKGLQGLAFIVQRNGERDERLPTSLTCFGRLLLPEYSSEKILEEKLRQAIENSLGFGVA